MKRQPELALFAGHDPFEKAIGIGTGYPCSKLAKALICSRLTLGRYRRLREAAAVNPPVPARGRFPYNRRSVAETPRRRNNFTTRPEDYGFHA